MFDLRDTVDADLHFAVSGLLFIQIFHLQIINLIQLYTYNVFSKKQFSTNDDNHLLRVLFMADMFLTPNTVKPLFIADL